MSKSFPSVLEKEPAVVLYYAEWCPHCTVFMAKGKGEWNKCKKMIKSKFPGLKVYEIENDTMNMLPPKYCVSAFPMIKCYHNSSHRGTEFNGPSRSSDMIFSFIESEIGKAKSKPSKKKGLKMGGGCSDVCTIPNTN